MNVRKLENLPLQDLQPLLEESLSQNFHFLNRLVLEYDNGENRFDQQGEGLYSIYSGHKLIAIGGLNQDPYLEQKNIARVRHLYVLDQRRLQGVGRMLMNKIISDAYKEFEILTLRTFSKSADKFYRRLGFQTEKKFENVSHYLILHDQHLKIG